MDSITTLDKFYLFKKYVAHMVISFFFSRHTSRTPSSYSSHEGPGDKRQCQDVLCHQTSTPDARSRPACFFHHNLICIFFLALPCVYANYLLSQIAVPKTSTNGTCHNDPLDCSDYSRCSPPSASQTKVCRAKNERRRRRRNMYPLATGLVCLFYLLPSIRSEEGNVLFKKNSWKLQKKWHVENSHSNIYIYMCVC